MKKNNIAKTIITEAALNRRLDELAAEVSADYQGQKPVLISVLKGSLYFLADLTRRISIPLNIDFLAVGRYPGLTEETGVVRITKDLDLSISGRRVLIVEDYVDTGLTIGYLLRNLEPRRPANLQICTLLDNPARRLVDLPLRYRGFRVSEENLVGYGLDYRENYRHLPYIAVLKET